MYLSLTLRPDSSPLPGRPEGPACPTNDQVVESYGGEPLAYLHTDGRWYACADVVDARPRSQFPVTIRPEVRTALRSMYPANVSIVTRPDGALSIITEGVVDAIVVDDTMIGVRLFAQHEGMAASAACMAGAAALRGAGFDVSVVRWGGFRPDPGTL